MKVSPEARRPTKYKEKKKETSVATLQFDVTFCTPILCAPSLHAENEDAFHLVHPRSLISIYQSDLSAFVVRSIR